MSAPSSSGGSVFVTGTDTGVGKTVVSVGLVRALARRHGDVAGLKPVVSGSVGEPPMWEDVLLHELAGGSAIPEAWRAGVRMRLPASPHFAAAAEGQQITLEAIVEGVRRAHAQVRHLVVEGVGGFCVPLNEQHDTADLACALGFPVILVVGLRLGCINHARLTADAIRARGLPLAGWVANAGVDLQYPWVQETVHTLERAFDLPCAALLPSLGTPLPLESTDQIALGTWRKAWDARIEQVAVRLEALAAHSLSA